LEKTNRRTFVTAVEEKLETITIYVLHTEPEEFRAFDISGRSTGSVL
jgi:hypothetical protein